MVKFGKFRNSLQHVDVHVLVSWGTGGGVPVCIHPARMRSGFCGCRSTNGFLILIRLYLFFVIIKCCALVASTTTKS